MNTCIITIDGQSVDVTAGETVLQAARRSGLDIPTLCHLEKCGPLTACLVCLVKINGKLVPSCGTKVAPGMVIESETEEIHEARRTALELIFSDHVGDCLSPCHRLCPLQLNIPLMIRQIEEGRLDEAIVTVRQALPLPAVLGRLCHHPCEQGCRRGSWDDPAAIRDLERFVADQDLGRGVIFDDTKRISHPNNHPEPRSSRHEEAHNKTGEESQSLLTSAATVQEGIARGFSGESLPDPDKSGLRSEGLGEGKETVLTPGASDAAPRQPYLPPLKTATGKSVAIIGAGPTGLAAAYYLVRQGHAITVIDRHDQAGGTLRSEVAEKDLPREVLDAEIAQLARLGIEFKPGVELGKHVTLDDLAHQHDAILLTVGELAKGDGDKLGVALASTGIKADPNTCRTSLANVFAAGAAVKPVRQLVRAMSEGRAAAECVQQFLSGRPVRRSDKPFSSVMGRLDPGELRAFLSQAGAANRVSPCDACRGHTAGEAATEAARCLHCDCRSSGNCVLQHYAQVYGVDANRFRAERRRFEQQRQPGGVIFEPGKCILCGICVKLTELAREPLGLTFIGRGFDVRVAAPFNRAIADGLQKVAEECVKHCPTGALVFAGKKATPPGST